MAKRNLTSLISALSLYGIPLEASKKEYVTYPSGMRLEVVNNPYDKYCPRRYFKDPNNSENKLVRVNPSYINRRISKHFRLGEFASIGHPGYVPVNYKQRVDGNEYFRCIRLAPSLIDHLERLRSTTGALEVKSGYRPPKYNIECEGKPHGRHPSGDAVDTKYVLKAPKVKKKVEKVFCDGGVGRGPNVTHFDARGKKARWQY